MPKTLRQEIEAQLRYWEVREDPDNPQSSTLLAIDGILEAFLAAVERARPTFEPGNKHDNLAREAVNDFLSNLTQEISERGNSSTD